MFIILGPELELTGLACIHCTSIDLQILVLSSPPSPVGFLGAEPRIEPRIAPATFMVAGATADG